MKLNDYVTLGRSGLRVSPLCLGTMTFGEDWGWGSSETEAEKIFNCYIDAGGNFLDTADAYISGKSEEMLGKFIRARKLRDKVVLATKFTFNMETGNPNAGGNGRKNIYRAVDASLKRLGTDFIDLYWMHVWDKVTPVEEVLSTLNDLLRQGKIRHYGLSDVPVWYLAKMQTLASCHFLEPITAIQLEYSLVERNIEREHIPAAQEFGIAVCPWSPLAGGFLSGKYKKVKNGQGAQGRLDVVKNSGNPVFEKFTAKNWAILAALETVAQEVGKSPAQVALSWVVNQKGITSTLIGATKLSQLENNLQALEIVLSKEQMAKLDAASILETIHPYIFFGEEIQGMVNGGAIVNAWRKS